MIYGIGTDIVKIARLQRSMEQNTRMAQKLFTEAEISYCESRASKYQSYAARFAAKEAVMKALGTGWDERVHWQNIEIIKPDDSAPCVVLHNDTKAFAIEQGLGKIHLSISHEKDYATAFVVVEKTNS
ncbi:MAG TPA: holo-ACP synthase [Candidatus Cloacimonadota bacterium]|nr:holo-ACP synthase [Candidatus Cloacimonadota bacterium]